MNYSTVYLEAALRVVDVLAYYALHTICLTPGLGQSRSLEPSGAKHSKGYASRSYNHPLGCITSRATVQLYTSCVGEVNH